MAKKSVQPNESIDETNLTRSAFARLADVRFEVADKWHNKNSERMAAQSDSHIACAKQDDATLVKHGSHYLRSDCFQSFAVAFCAFIPTTNCFICKHVCQQKRVVSLIRQLFQSKRLLI